jgi:OOP family OmpA-OmpF porin
MNLRPGVSPIVIATALLFATRLLGQEEEQGDIEGSKDHPQISRFTGTAIVQYNYAKFGELTIPLSNKPESPPAERVEGELTTILYQIPGTASSHEVFRSYQQELGRAGFKTLYSCTGSAQCGSDWPGYIQDTYPLSNRGSAFAMGLSDYESQRYLAAARQSPEGDTYVMLYAWEFPQGSKYAMLNVVEREPLREGLVTISAEQMAKDILATGHVPIYGVYFDFDKADIKPESQAALQEMAKLLAQDANLSVYIVGHTDNVGTLAHNLDLSQRRADAVVKALVGQHGVAAKRLTGRGVGPVAPVASNRSEEGRAKNRRVELVER